MPKIQIGPYPAVAIENADLRLAFHPETGNVLGLLNRRTEHESLLTIQQPHRLTMYPGLAIEPFAGVPHEVREEGQALHVLAERDGLRLEARFALPEAGCLANVELLVTNQAGESRAAPIVRGSFVPGRGGALGYCGDSHFYHRVFVRDAERSDVFEWMNEKYTWNRYDIARPQWIALVDPTQSEGVLVLLEAGAGPATIAHEYHCLGVTLRPEVSVLAPGERCTLRFQIGVFRGADRVDLATADWLAALDLAPVVPPGRAQSATLRVIGLRKGTVSGTLAFRDLPRLAPVPLASFAGEVAPDRPLVQSVTTPPVEFWHTKYGVSVPFLDDSYSLIDLTIGELTGRRAFWAIDETAQVVARVHASADDIARSEDRLPEQRGGARLVAQLVDEAQRTLDSNHTSERLRHDLVGRFYELEELLTAVAQAEARDYRTTPRGAAMRRLRDIPELEPTLADEIRRAQAALDQPAPIDYPNLRSRIPDESAALAGRLALAYQLTGESAFGQRAREILLAFAAHHRRYGNIRCETIHESNMAGALLTVYDWVWELLSPVEHAAVLRYLWWTLDLVEPFVNNTGQNWDAMECAAVARLAGRFPYLPRAPRQLRRAADVFRGLTDEVQPDGAWVEQAPGYHIVTLTSFVTAAEALHAAGIDVYAEPVGERLRRMFAWMMDVVTPGDVFPSIEDSGSLIPPADLFLLAAARFREPTFLDFALNCLEREMERGPSAVARTYHLGYPSYPTDLVPRRQERPLSEVLNGSGRVILRSGLEREAQYFVLDFGPHRSHGHFDKLSFELHAFGQPLVLDAGTGLYESPDHATWDLQTIAHNTIQIDGASQQPTEGEVESFTSLPDADFLSVSSETYPGVRHRRRVLYWRGHAYFIADDLESASGHRYTWLCHADGQLRRETTASGGGTSIFQTSQGPGVLVELAEDADVTEGAGPGGERDTRRPIPFIAASRNGASGSSFHALLTPFATQPPMGRAKWSAEGRRVEVDRATFAIGASTGDDVQTDARAWLKTEHGLCAFVLTKLSGDGLSIQADRQLFGVSIDLRQRRFVVSAAAPTRITIERAGKRCEPTVPAGETSVELPDV